MPWLLPIQNRKCIFFPSRLPSVSASFILQRPRREKSCSKSVGATLHLSRQYEEKKETSKKLCKKTIVQGFFSGTLNVQDANKYSEEKVLWSRRIEKSCFSFFSAGILRAFFSTQVHCKSLDQEMEQRNSDRDTPVSYGKKKGNNIN